MKKLKILIIAILTLALCLSAPLMISAEEPESVEESVSAENADNSTPEEEKPAESEIVASEGIADGIANYVRDNLEELLMMLATGAMAIYVKVKDTKLGGTLNVLHSNAAAIAKNAVTIAENAASKIDEASKTVDSFGAKLTALMDRIERSEEEKEVLAATIREVKSVLSATKVLTMDAADTIDELLMLSNVPNSAKDDMHSKHLTARKEVMAIGGEGE